MRKPWYPGSVVKLKVILAAYGTSNEVKDGKVSGGEVLQSPVEGIGVGVGIKYPIWESPLIEQGTFHPLSHTNYEWQTKLVRCLNIHTERLSTSFVSVLTVLTVSKTEEGGPHILLDLQSLSLSYHPMNSFFLHQQDSVWWKMSPNFPLKHCFYSRKASPNGIGRAQAKVRHLILSKPSKPGTPLPVCVAAFFSHF